MKKLALLIAAFLRLPIMHSIPGGIVADNVGEWGLFGFMKNANSYAAAMASYATTGNAVAVSAEDFRRGVIKLNSGASTGFNINLPTTAQIFSELGDNVVPKTGNFWKPIFFVNNGVGQTGTVVAGDAMTTIIGTATVADSFTRIMMARVLGSTLTLSNIGTLAL